MAIYHVTVPVIVLVDAPDDTIAKDEARSYVARHSRGLFVDDDDAFRVFESEPGVEPDTRVVD